MEFNILGPFQVVDGDAAVDIGGPKQRAVLAVLLLSAGRVVTLDRIIDELWGDEPPARATGTLQAYVSNLRRVLEPDRAPRTPASVLASRPPGYVLQVAAEAIDATRFERLLSRGRASLDSGHPADARADLVAALGLWRGSPLAEFSTEPFARDAIDRLTELRSVAVETRLAAELALGHHDTAAVELGGLVRQQPLRERLWELLMLALYRSGRQGDALRAYQAARSTLGDELGVEPGPALVRLERAVLAQDPALDWRAPTAAPRASPSGPLPLVASAPSVPPTERVEPLVGRAREIAEWERALDRASGVRLVLLGGEAGAGKTRLAEEFARSAERAGRLVAWARCSETPGVPAFWPWRQVVRAIVGRFPAAATERAIGPSRADLTRILPELAGAPSAELRTVDDADAARFQLYDSVTAFLDTLTAGCAISAVVDDLQWADPWSLRMLQFLVTDRRVPGLLLVATYRDPDNFAGSALHDTLTALASESSVVHLQLGGLGNDDVRGFIEQSSGERPSDEVVATILRRTAGNAFFVAELTRLLAAEGRLRDAEAARSRVRFPAELQAVIDRRLARLPADATDVLTVAAVLGEEFSLDVLERATDVPLERLLDFVEMSVLTRIVVEAPSPGTYRFAHALIRECLYDALTRVRRARLHARVTAALESLWSDDVQPHVAELAFHAFQGAEAGTAAAAVRYSMLAARDAAEQLAFEQEAGHWRQALAGLDLARPADRDTRYEILMGLSRATRCSGDVDASQRAVRQAIELVTRMGDDERMARAAVGLSRGAGTTWSWRTYGSVDEEAIELLERALATLGPGDSALRAEVMATLGVELYYAADRQRGVELSREAVAMAVRLGDAQLRATMLNMYYVASQGADRPERRLGIAEQMLQLPEQGAPEEVGLVARVYRMVCRLELGDLDAADADLEVAAAAAARMRQPAMLAQLAWYRAMRALMAGHLDDAERLSTEALALHQRTCLWGAWECYTTQLFTLRREQGRILELEPVLGQLAATSEFVGFREAAALMYLDLGRPDDARAALGERASFPPMPRDWSWEFLSCLQAEVCAELGDDLARRRLRDELAPFADVLAIIGTGVCCWGPVAYFVGRLETALGHAAEAMARFDQAIEISRRVGAVPWRERAEARRHALLVVH